MNTCFHWRVQCNSLGSFHSYGNSVRILISEGPSCFRKIKDIWIVFLRSCMSGCRSQTSPTRILNLLKKSRHKSQHCTLHLLSYSTGLCIHAPIAYPHSQVPPVRSCFYSVVWEQHQGAVPNLIPNIHMDTAWDEAHSWVCAPCWLVETLISPVHTRALKSTSRWCQAFSKSGFTWWVPNAQLLFQCARVARYADSSEVSAGFPVSWYPCIPFGHGCIPQPGLLLMLLLTGFPNTRGTKQGKARLWADLGAVCVCWWQESQCFSPYWPVLPKDGDCFSGEVHSFLF